MTAKELQYLVIPQPVPNKIGMKVVTAGGTAHPLWDILNNRFQPNVPWRQLGGAVRAGVVRAGELLHEQNIPYNFYADFIQRFNKTYLKRQPMSLVGHRQRKDGSVPLLREYLTIMTRLRQLYAENPLTFKVNDAVYKMFPGSYELGVMKYMYSVGAIADALKTHDEQRLLRLLSRANAIEDFWTALGYQQEQQPPAPTPVLDLSEGYSDVESTKTLGRELQIRQNPALGQPNPELNKFFNTHNKLNVQGLRVISGERRL